MKQQIEMSREEANIMRLFMFIIWILFIGYAWLMAPGHRGGEDEIMQKLLTLQHDEPSLLAMFSLLGLYPMAFAFLLLRNDRADKPAWPFSLGAFVLGAFALIPYYFMNDFRRMGHRNRLPHKHTLLLKHPFLLLILMIGTMGVFIYGFAAGNLAVYQEAFQQSQFVHVMTVDFAVLTLLSMYAIHVDQRLRATRSRLWWLGLFPIIGLLLYLWQTAEDVY
ncbi:hypothetical protein [Marinicrinis sediminis]|uniref:DUF2834 domain-containing protein n=1 Tax=Marinicrinis sediminis TaxID=1652465 RepID=A0ABW5R988_9BACL